MVNVIKKYPPVIPKTPQYLPNIIVDNPQRIPPTIEFIKKVLAYDNVNRSPMNL